MVIPEENMLRIALGACCNTSIDFLFQVIISCIPPKTCAAVVFSVQSFNEGKILFRVFRLQGAGEVETAYHDFRIYASVFAVIEAHGE